MAAVVFLLIFYSYIYIDYTETACVPQPYVRIGGFVRATACLIHPTFTQGFIR